MTGAGGGLAGGLWSAFGAELKAGAESVLEAVSFDRALASASVVVTGEGRLDEQTGEGKLVAEIARRSSRAGIPCIAVVGSNGLTRAAHTELGIAEVIEASTLDELTRCGPHHRQALLTHFDAGGVLADADSTNDAQPPWSRRQI